MPESNPKLSVVMITFNHEKYIEQAVRSVLMQQIDFDYEIIIGDDCSTDRTPELLAALRYENPEVIKLVLYPQNVGMMCNLVNVLNIARGQYIALLEGDDYWTSPHKLQLQADYMEAHPECRLCVHEVNVIHEGRPNLSNTIRKPKQNAPTGIEGVHEGAHTHTSAVVFRSISIFPDWLCNLKVSGDWALLTWLLLQGGKIGFVAGPPMSVYRRNSGGITFRSGAKRWLNMIDDVFVFISHLEKPMSFRQRKRVFHPVLFGRHLALSRIYIAEGRLEKARYHSVRTLYYAPLFSWKSQAKAWRIIAQSYIPELYKIAKLIKLRYFIKK